MASRKSKPPKPVQPALDFGALVAAIQQVQAHSAAAANRAVNIQLTLRNWAIGAYIHHYEMHGADRADYGDRLLPRLAERLAQENINRTQERELRRYRAFYLAYPQIRESLPPESLPTPILEFRETASPELKTVLPKAIEGQKLLNSLSFSHFAELLTIADPIQRSFYEIESIRGNWSVRALQRQIASLYFERSALSTDKDRLSAMVHSMSEETEPRIAIRDPYVFEFLGLRPSETMLESDLEHAMLANLQEFLLELGH